MAGKAGAVFRIASVGKMDTTLIVRFNDQNDTGDLDAK
jgi:hypothetical protein